MTSRRSENHATRKVTAILLAAGKSTRMGKPKQLLPFAETTVLGQTIATVRGAAPAASIAQIILVLGASAELIREHLPTELPEGIEIVVNPTYQQGMATSVRAGLAAVKPQHDAALLVLGDQPLLQTETLHQLVAAQHSSGAQIVIPTYRNVRGNPVLLHRALFAEAMALEGDQGCRAIFSAHPNAILNVEVEDEGILLDIDNPEDYQRLLALAAARKAAQPHS